MCVSIIPILRAAWGDVIGCEDLCVSSEDATIATTHTLQGRMNIEGKGGKGIMIAACKSGGAMSNKLCL